MYIKYANKKTLKIVSLVLACAVLLVSLPLTLGVGANGTTDVPKITEATYPVGDVLWSFNASEISSAPDWQHGLVKNGWTSNGTTTLTYNSETNSVNLKATALDGMFYLPSISGDSANYIFEVSYNVSGAASSAGLAINATPATGATYIATYHSGKDSGAESGNKYGYYRRKGTTVLSQTFYQNKYTQPVAGSTTPETLKVVVLNGYTYAYVNNELMLLADGVEGFADPNATEGAINLGLFVTNSEIAIYSIKVTAIAEPTEVLVWNGSFDGALPTTDKNGDGEIEITTPEEFAAVAKSNGRDADGNRIKYELTSDIYLNDTKVEGWKDNNPNSWLAPVKLADITSDNCFYGIVNGNGYVVHGMYVDATVDVTRTKFSDVDYLASAVLANDSADELDLYEDVFAGLFPVIGKGSALVGIGIEDAYVCVKDSSPDITLTDGSTKPMNLVGSVGALVGVVANSGSEYAIIDQCYADSSVNLVGGRTALIGCGNKTTNFVVSNCYAHCASTQFKGTKGTNAAGTDNKEWDNNVGNRFMLVSGNGAKPTISSCYCYGNITNNGNFDKAVGGVNNVYYYDGWANASYATLVDGNAIKGSGAASLMPNLDWTKFETREGMRPVLSVFTTHNLGTDGAVWDGSADSQLVDNDGDGYLDITNVAELNSVVSSGNGNYELVKDIWVNDISVYPKGGFFLADRAPKVWNASEWFKGNFNGNGHVVHGLFYNTKPVDEATSNKNSIRSGLFADLAPNTTVTGVGVQDSFIMNHSGYSMGAISGTLTQAGVVIDQCFSDDSVYLHGYKGVGGLVGQGNKKLTIKNSYSTAYIKITAGDRNGGLVGDSWTANVITLQNCYTNSSKVVGNGIALINSYAYYSTSNTSGATRVSATDMMGSAALTKMSNLNANGKFQATNRYPVLKIFDPNYVEEEAVGEVWNGSVAAAYAGGTGTEADPYIISKGSQLARAINSFGENGAYFKLDRDIYLNEKLDDTSNGWFDGVVASNAYNAYHLRVNENAKTGTLGAFNGNIDGNGFHIYGLNYRSGNSSNASGLIPMMAAGSIKNLGLDNARIIASGKAGEEGTTAGGLIGRTKQTGMIYIDRCYVGSNVSFTSGGGKGGIVGYAQGNTDDKYLAISNSYVLATMPSEGKACALIGETWRTYYTIENVWSISVPINPASVEARASQFYVADATKMGDYLKNVFCCSGGLDGDYEIKGDVTAYKNLTNAEMRGTRVFEKMTVNGDDAFLYNIGYPTLKIFGNSIPTENELLSGLINIATAMPMTEYKIDTNDFIISGNFVAGKEIKVNLVNGENTGAVTFATDGTVTISSSAGDSTSRQFTLSGTVEYKISAVGGFLLVYVNGECAGLVAFDAAPGYTATFTGFDLDNDSIMVDLYVQDITFDGVKFDNVNVQLADRLGNKTSGGVKFDTVVTDSADIENMGYDVEYGMVISVGNELPDEITADTATRIEFNSSADTFEFVGLSTAKQELFFAVRGYAKIIVNEEVDYYYYTSETTVFSPIYEANDFYANADFAEAIKAIYGASDKFIENYTQDIEFAVFADYHYKTGMYTSILSDLKAVVDTAKTLNDGQGADFILSLGDMTNDMKGSKEITNYLLDGKYSFRGTEIAKDHNFTFFNLYGNHELESSGNSMDIVSPTLTNNAAAHWGDGTVGRAPANNQYGYYYADVNGFRLIVTDTNYSWNPNHIKGEVVGWEHNLTASYGSPLAAHNATRGFDEGAAAVANSNTNSLGPVQMEWLEGVLMDAVEKGIPCVVAGHSPFITDFGQGADAPEVRALFKKANDIRTGTVLASINGHQHTNRQTVYEDVLYLDINTVRNSEWRGTSEAHYNSGHAFTIDNYDVNGNYVSSSESNLNALGMGKQTWFANDPVHSSIKITQRGYVEMTGCKSKYMYDVIPSGYKDYAYPGQNSGYWTLGDSNFTVTEKAWPEK